MSVIDLSVFMGIMEASSVSPGQARKIVAEVIRHSENPSNIEDMVVCQTMAEANVQAIPLGDRLYFCTMGQTMPKWIAQIQPVKALSALTELREALEEADNFSTLKALYTLRSVGDNKWISGEPVDSELQARLDRAGVNWA